MLKENIVQLLSRSIRNHWEINALSNYQGTPMTYGEVGNEMIRWHRLFEKLEIEQGDKIALVGKNQAQWAVIYLASISFGAVIVPVLPDFSSRDLQHILIHSDSKMLFADKEILAELPEGSLDFLKMVFSLNSTDNDIEKYLDRSGLGEGVLKQFSRKEFRKITGKEFPDLKMPNDQLAVINYTSGTTGFSKGVMLLHNNLSANITFARNAMSLEPGDRILSFLPLAHAFGCAFDFLYPFTMGCHITFLNKLPSPMVVMKAFSEIRPRLIFSVPLIIEKIYKNQIQPRIGQNVLNFLIHIPVINRLIYANIRKKIYHVFGGNFREMIIGGAALNHKAERFFKKAKLPITVGYGMTECGPLISYAPWDRHRKESAGKLVDTLEIKIDSEDPNRKVGEILVKGENVMLGYYKNPDATRQVIDQEGWLHTGDLGVIDLEMNIYIRGRSKNMILGPSGQNIYPEEIESMINNLPYVSESLVVERNHKLVVLIFPDLTSQNDHEVGEVELAQLLDQEIKKMNEHLPGYMRITRIEIMKNEFEKTPKRSIKRFIYQ
jgi:long-chain acyl-CoA synthetase